MHTIGYTTMIDQMEKGAFTEVTAKNTIDNMYAYGRITDEEYKELMEKANGLSPNTETGETMNRIVALEKGYEALKLEVENIKSTVESGGSVVPEPDEGATGGYDDPIEAYRGMTYYKDKYYRDPDDGQVYKCYRDSDTNPGSGIALYFLPHELVNQYFYFDRVS